MKKIIILSIISTITLIASESHRIDSGNPTLEELINDGYVYESIEILKKEREKRLLKEGSQRKIFESWDAPNKNELMGVVVEKKVKKENVTNTYDIEEVEVKGHLLYRKGKLLNNCYVRVYYENIKAPGKRLREIMQISNGYINGVIKEYHLNGKIKRKYSYINNKMEGKEEIYDTQGRLREVSMYENDTRNGIRRAYDIDGDEIFNIMYKNGIIEGEVVEYYKNKNIKRKIKYTNNKKDGNELRYAENGNIIKEDVYKKGILQKRTLYNSWSGNIYKIIIYKESKPYIEKVYDYEGEYKKDILLQKEKTETKKEKIIKEEIPKGSIIFENKGTIKQR